MVSGHTGDDGAVNPGAATATDSELRITPIGIDISLFFLSRLKQKIFQSTTNYYTTYKALCICFRWFQRIEPFAPTTPDKEMVITAGEREEGDAG